MWSPMSALLITSSPKCSLKDAFTWSPSERSWNIEAIEQIPSPWLAMWSWNRLVPPGIGASNSKFRDPT